MVLYAPNENYIGLNTQGIATIGPTTPKGFSRTVIGLDYNLDVSPPSTLLKGDPTDTLDDDLEFLGELPRGRRKIIAWELARYHRRDFSVTKTDKGKGEK